MSNGLRERPRVDVPRTFVDYIGEILSITGVLAAIFLLVITWSDLPGEVPRHFGFTGEPTAWSDRTFAILPIGIAIAIYVAFTLLARVPHIFNYVVKITEENAPIQYRLARSLMIWLKAIIVWMFVVIIWSQLRVATGDADGVNPLLIIGAIIGTQVVLGIYIYRSVRWRDGVPDERQNTTSHQ